MTQTNTRGRKVCLKNSLSQEVSFGLFLLSIKLPVDDEE